MEARRASFLPFSPHPQVKGTVEEKVSQTFQVSPVGVVRRKQDSIEIEIFPRYREALSGLERFSHIIVLYWFHRTDNPIDRLIMQVHPRRDPSKPLTGVFATRSPARPNPVAFSVSKILSIRENAIQIDRTDALDETPVIDIKPYIPESDSRPEAGVPEWVAK